MGITWGDGFPASLVSSFNTIAVINTEAGMLPTHQLINQIIGDLSLLFQKLEYFSPEKLFQRFQIHSFHHMKQTGVCK